MRPNPSLATSPGLVVIAALLATLLGCASIGKPPRAASGLKAAGTKLDTTLQEVTDFYTDLEPLLEGIRGLREHPGWNDMELIVMEQSQDMEDGEAEPSPSVDAALEDWSAKWGESGQAFFLRYLALADRCSAMEMRRIGLGGQLAALQAVYLEAVFLELSAGREAEAQSIFETVQALGKTEDELNSFQLDALGLYDSVGSRKPVVGP